MNCDSFADAIVECGRREGSAHDPALDIHLDRCPDCAARLDRERAISAGLRALADGADAIPSPGLEANLQQAFASHHARSATGARKSSVWLQVAAAAIVVAGALVAWRASNVSPPPPEPSPEARTPGGFVVADGFVPLPVAVGLPDFESGEIVRVEIPVTSLPSYGIEIVPDARRSPVQADLLVGQDGHARAIRLVRASDVTP
jgi:hypothetical protein